MHDDVALRVHVLNIWVLGCRVVVIIVQVLGKYMIIRYLDPQGNVFYSIHLHVQHLGHWVPRASRVYGIHGVAGSNASVSVGLLALELKFHIGLCKTIAARRSVPLARIKRVQW